MSNDALARATTVHEIVDEAHRCLAPELWTYVAGAAETETTSWRNRHALDSLALRPRVLRDVSQIDSASTLLGRRMRIPVLLAPLGGLQLLTPEGGLAAARAAAEFGVLSIEPVTEPGLEQIAASAVGPKACQLYIRGDRDWCDELVDRVVAAGFDALTLTVDAAYYGRRERQLRSGWAPPSQREGPELDRVWQARLTWDWLARMRERGGLPVILKGIQCAADAELAVEHGIEAIYVSNHGGRELDHAPATLEILREVIDAVAGRAEVIVDGGIMRGTDVMKAIALGADAVGIGRLQAFALAAGGQAALTRVLELLEIEIQNTMGLLGVTRLAELDPSFVRSAPAPWAPSPLRAAFPERGLNEW